MPKVPVIDQTATGSAPFATPQVAPVRNYAPQQQEALGQTMQRAGGMAMVTGQTIGDRLAEQVDDARTKQAETTALSSVQGLLYGENGYLNTLGQNAIDGLSNAKQSVVKAFQDQLDGLGNPIQKHMFTQVMNQHLLSFGQQMDQHNVQQTRQFSGEAAAARANTYATNASNAWSSYGQTDADGNPTGDFAKHLATAEAETLHAAYITKGAPPESDVAKEALLMLHTQIGTGAVVQMMDARAPYSKVQSLYDNMKDKGWLSMQATTSLGKMVKTYTEQEGIRSTVNQSLSDAYRASQGQPTNSTGTPDYRFGIRGAVPGAQTYDPENGAVVVPIPQGSSIQAPADGTVTQAGKGADGSFTMKIQHADGSVTTLTGLSAANVKAGDKVQGGEDVATSGAVANSKNPAVVWSLTDKNGNAVDPMKAGLAPVDLTKITDEKVLSNALDSVRSQIKDPYLQQQATSEMESIVRHNQQMANAQATQIFKQAGDAFYAGGMQWRKIPPSIFNQLTPEQRQHFKDAQTEEILKRYNQGQAFKNMSEVDIVSDFIANPQAITTANVETARPHLSNATYLSLMGKAQQFAQNHSNVVEAQAVGERIKYFASNAGITADDKQLLIDLTYKINNDIDQIKAQNHGKATAAQVDEAIKQELIQHTLSTPRSAWNPLRVLGISPSTSEQKYSFQMPAGATHVAPGSDGKMHYTDGKNDLGVVQ